MSFSELDPIHGDGRHLLLNLPPWHTDIQTTPIYIRYPEHPRYYTWLGWSAQFFSIPIIKLHIPICPTFLDAKNQSPQFVHCRWSTSRVVWEILPDMEALQFLADHTINYKVQQILDQMIYTLDTDSWEQVIQEGWNTYYRECIQRFRLRTGIITWGSDHNEFRLGLIGFHIRGKGRNVFPRITIYTHHRFNYNIVRYIKSFRRDISKYYFFGPYKLWNFSIPDFSDLMKTKEYFNEPENQWIRTGFERIYNIFTQKQSEIIKAFEPDSAGKIKKRMIDQCKFPLDNGFNLYL